MRASDASPGPDRAAFDRGQVDQHRELDEQGLLGRGIAVRRGARDHRLLGGLGHRGCDPLVHEALCGGDDRRMRAPLLVDPPALDGARGSP